MLITRTSPFSGQVNTKDLPVTEDQLTRWQNGELIQNVFPHINADDREFIKTGITGEEWNSAFGE